MLEIVAESVSGVEVVLRQGEGSRRGGGPGVNQRRLNHVVFRLAAAHKTAAVLYHDVYFRPLVQVVTQVRKLLPHDGGGDDRIDLHAGNVAAAGRERPQHIPTATWSDDQ